MKINKLILAIPFLSIFALTGCGLFGGDNTSEASVQPVQSVTVSTVAEFEEEMDKHPYSTKSNTLKPIEIGADLDFGGVSKQYSISNVRISGNNHTLKNFNILVANYGGLFSKTYNCYFDNLTIDTATVSGSTSGSLVGYAYATYFENIKTTNSVVVGDGAGNNVGGIVGYGYESTEFKDCVNQAEIKGVEKVGGIVGFAYDADVHGCVNKGKVTGYNGKHIGGVVGGFESYWRYDRHVDKFSGNKNEAAINGIASDFVGGCLGAFIPNVYALNNLADIANGNQRDYPVPLFDNDTNEGNVEGHDNVGGIIGGMTKHDLVDPKVTLCINKGSVEGRRYVGGIMGYTPKRETEFSSCKNELNVAGDNYVKGDYYVGGIAGRGWIAKNCENKVPISLKKTTEPIDLPINIPNYQNQQYAIGGIIGLADYSYSCEFTNNKNSGTISGYYNTPSSYYGLASSIGGIVGFCQGGSFISNENTGKIDGHCCGGGIAGTVLPKKKTTFTSNVVNCDFKCSWYFGGIVGYFYVEDSGWERASITNSTVTVSKAELFSASVSNFGGIVGGALANSTATGYYQKLSLVGCSADVKYVPAVSNTNIEPIVGENGESTSGSKMVIIDSGMVSDCSVSLWSE